MSERDKEEKSGGIKVVDRRRFTASGESRSDAPSVDPVKPPPPRPSSKDEGRKNKEGRSTGQGPDFLSFVASLATNAMAALGVLPEAQARGMPVNHQMAREYIEIIAMLQERTQGNLSREEEQALQRLLSELRMQFVEATQGAGAAGAAKHPHMGRR